LRLVQSTQQPRGPGKTLLNVRSEVFDDCGDNENERRKYDDGNDAHLVQNSSQHVAQGVTTASSRPPGPMIRRARAVDETRGPAHNDASLFTSARKAFCANGGIDASGPNRKPDGPPMPGWFCTGPDTP
jgi:hypothetical protein